MNKYYLVVYNGNYADEFSVYFHTVMSEEQLKEVKDLISKTHWVDEEFYFGTNESISVSTEELMKYLKHPKEITEEEYNVLNKLGLLKISFGDGLNWDDFVDFIGYE